MSAGARAAEIAATEISVEKVVTRLALPAVGEQLLNASVAVVDTFLVGHLGAVELTAVGLAGQFVLTFTALFSATAVGCTALIARSTGARDWPLAQRAVGQSVLLALLIGSLMALVGWLFGPQLMALVSPDEATQALGGNFLRLVSLTMPLTALLFVGNACLRGAGDTGTPLRVMILVNGINIAVAWTLVDGRGITAPLGVAGVAIGAMLARGVGGLVILLLLLKGHFGLRLRWHAVPPDWSVMRRIVRVGIPSGLETATLRVGQLVFAGIVASLGPVAYAAHVITLNSESMSFMPGFGFGAAATTVVGQSLGAKRPDRATRGAYYAFWLGAGMMSVLGLVFVIWPGVFVSVFTSDPAVQAAAIVPMRIAGLLQPGVAAMIIFSGALRGAGDTRWPLYINGLSIWLVRVLGCSIVIRLGGGLNAIWILLFLDMTVRGIASAMRFRSGRWQTTKV